MVDQELQFTYILANGSEDTVSVDVSKFLAESEFGNGLQVDELTGVVSVKVDAASEAFLTVGADGVKLAGVQTAIDNAKTAAEKVATDFNTAMNTRVETLETAVGAGGSVETQITNAINALDATVGDAAVAEGKHVAVQVVETDGVITAVNVKESDIASAQGLTNLSNLVGTAADNKDAATAFGKAAAA